MEEVHENLNNYPFLIRIIKEMEEHYNIYPSIKPYKVRDYDGLAIKIDDFGELMVSEVIIEDKHSIAVRVHIDKTYSKTGDLITFRYIRSALFASDEYDSLVIFLTNFALFTLDNINFNTFKLPGQVEHLAEIKSASTLANSGK